MQKKFFNGRGMIEMLAVLAVIGVLSVGGLVAYKVAMTKHRTNNLYNDLQLSAFSVYERGDLNGFAINEPIPIENSKQYDISARKIDPSTNNGATFAIEVSGISRSMCKELLKMQLGTPYIIMVGGQPFNPQNPNYRVCDVFGNASLDIFISSAWAAIERLRPSIIIPMPAVPMQLENPGTYPEEETAPEEDEDDTAGDEKPGEKPKEETPKDGDDDNEIDCAEGLVPTEIKGGKGKTCCEPGSVAALDIWDNPECCYNKIPMPIKGGSPGAILCCPSGQSAYAGRATKGCCEGEVFTNSSGYKECCESVFGDFVARDSNGKEVCCTKDNAESGFGGKAGCCGQGQDAVKVQGGSSYKCCPHAYQAFVNASGNAECCGTVVYQKGNGLACCPSPKNMYWDDKAQTTKCCEGGFYTDSNGQTLCCKETEEKGCCKGKEYNKNSEKCCNGEIIDIEVCCDEYEECCGSKKLDQGYKCCYEEPIPEEVCCEETEACCNGEKIDLEKQKCCDYGNGHQVPMNKEECCSSEGQRCCGKKYYNPDLMVDVGCCGGAENGQTYDKSKYGCCEKTGLTYQLGEQKCCNGRPVSVNSTECCEEDPDCCGGEVINPEEKKCCFGKPIKREECCDEYQRCCNGKELMIDEKCCGNEPIGEFECCSKEGESCCGKDYYLPGAVENLKCCEGPKGLEDGQLYDSTSEDCCGGKKIDLNVKKCCRGKEIDVNECCDEYESCCGDEFYIPGAQDWECCGEGNNGEKYDPEVEKCCNGEKIPLEKCCPENGEKCCKGKALYAGLECCADKNTYDPLVRGCCEETGNTYIIGQEKCCYGQPVAIFACCKEQGDHCCGEEFYNPNEKGCCNGKTYMLEVNGISYGCCGGSTYDTSVHGCCGDAEYGTKYVKDGTEKKCCDDNSAVSLIECCPEEKKEIKKDISACCGGTEWEEVLYCPLTDEEPMCEEKPAAGKKCCEGKEIAKNACCKANGDMCCGGKPEDIDSGKACCGDEYVGVWIDPTTEACCGVSGKYNMKTEKCCGNTTPMSKEACCKADGDECCGDVKIDSSKQKCCDGKPVALDACCKTNGDECCGDLKMDPKTEGCCNGKKTAVGKCCETETSGCCNNVSYRREIYRCCDDGKTLVDRNGGCCSNSECKKAGQHCSSGVCVSAGCKNDKDCGPNMFCHGDVGVNGRRYCDCNEYFTWTADGTACECKRKCEKWEGKLNPETCECIPDDDEDVDPEH